MTGRLFSRLWLATFIIFISQPAHSEIPGGGRPINMVSCISMEAAESYVEALVSKSPPALPGCVVYDKPFFPSRELMKSTKMVIGPLVDWQGDIFGVFKVARTDQGGHFYPIVWWAARFSPIGWKI